MEWTKDEYLVTDDSARVDVAAVGALLASSYWAAYRPEHSLRPAIQNSRCFSLFQRERQIGFARVVTDRATFAWICDVIIHSDFRGQGLGKWLMGIVVNHPDLAGAQQLLRTRDAHSLYEQFGFKRAECMQRSAP